MKRPETNQIVLCSSDTTSDQDIGLKELRNRDRMRGYFQCVHHVIIRRNGEPELGDLKYDEPARGLGGFNVDSVSVCLVGGRGDPPFTLPQLTTLRQLLAELKEEYPNARLKDHHEVNRKVAPIGLDLMDLSKESE